MRGAWVAVAVAASCGGNAGPVDVEAVLLDFEDDAGVSFEDCGSFAYSGQCFGSDPDTEGGGCLVDAFGACTPARYSVRFVTVEGDPITNHYYVVPTGSGCGVVSFRDTSKDSFSDVDLVREDCGGVDLLNTCPGVTLSACDETDRWGDDAE
ncbi:MAG: hypothetical protein H6733_03790 [Alphaproteobacteria bacterium]|nr:hypothetical protein [Alphaproteobacteria bacterium]